MNWLGTQTLLSKEVRRFLRVPGQTVASPLVSTTLYFLVFGFTLGGKQSSVDGTPYIQFIVPGLVFMSIASNAFLNSSSSLFITKIQGTVVDLLAAPLGARELFIGFVTGAMVRGLLVGVLTWLAAIFFAGIHSMHVLSTLFFLLLSAYVFAVLGLLAGLWAEKFEQINFFPTFLMLPLTFLGGVFYEVRNLPEPFRTISLFNPVVHMVQGLRAGMLGLDQSGSVVGASLLCTVAVGGTGLAYALLKSGYKLKS